MASLLVIIFPTFGYNTSNFPTMRCIFRKETDPYFNLAAEEFIFKNSDEDIFMLWRNSPAVIIGKHQNAFAEANRLFVEHRRIPVIRRISGGGTVYHDEGNINFTFMAHGEPEHLVDFNRFTQPVMEALKTMGLNVETGNRNSLYINGLKISGNAEHVYKNRILHHGTLLYNSNLEILEQSIRPPDIEYTDKAVKSVRSKVGNIADFIEDTPPVEDFAEKLFSSIVSVMPDAVLSGFTLKEVHEIEALSMSKYRLWEWNYGYSPPFSFPAIFTMNENEVPVEVHVKEGKIEAIELKDPDSGPSDANILNNLLLNVPLRHESVNQALRHYHQNNNTDQLMSALFPAGTSEHLPKLNV